MYRFIFGTLAKILVFVRFQLNRPKPNEFRLVASAVSGSNRPFKMNIPALGYTFCIVIVTNCALYETRTLYRVNPYNYVLSKRNTVERRGFLKSFCARRCNIGKGGNLCKCNGFHFAGKRNGNLPTFQEHQRPDFGDDTEQFVYKILQENDKIALDPEKYTLQNGMIPEEDILGEIDEIFPKVMNGELDNRSPQADLGELLEDYLRTEEM